MNKIYSLFIVMGLLILSGCGERVTINSGEVGKQITSGGLEDIIRDPGSFRMESCIFTACPRLVRLQTAVSAKTVTVNKVFLPKSNVTLDDVTFGIQFKVKPDKNSINSAFNTIKSEPVTDSKSDRIISSDQVFSTYIQRKAPEIVIAALREYTVEDALTKIEDISKFVKEKLNSQLKSTPIEITEFGFPNGVGTPPEIVLKAKEELYAIEEKKARDLKAYAAQLEIEKGKQKVAQARADNAQQIAKNLNVPVQEYMRLQVLERLADAAESGTPVAIGNALINQVNK